MFLMPERDDITNVGRLGIANNVFSTIKEALDLAKPLGDQIN